MNHEYDEDYFERGVEKHISGYTDYKWKPEYVLPMANWLKQKFGDVSFLDYGCAKGFLVKALRMLSCDAYGYDISEYAIENSEKEVKAFVGTDLKQYECGVIIAKDVLEHVPKDEMQETLQSFNSVYADSVIAIIPLGDDGKFRIREYEMDVTHVTKEDEVWWTNEFNKAGFVVDEFYYSLPGVKENWTVKYPFGNGIFILRKA